MAEWTFDAGGGGIRFGDGGPGLGGFLPDSARAVVVIHNIALAGLQQQLAERDAALAQEHVVAGEAMAWVEFLREPLTAIIAASDAQEWEAWERGMERARAALAECDPGKPGSTHPQPLKEAEAAMAGMRQVLEEIAKDGPPDDWHWIDLDISGDYQGYDDGTVLIDVPDESNAGDVHDHGEAVGAWGAAKIARRGLVPELGRDRLALEREMADIVKRAANIPLEQLARVGIVDLMETVHRLEEAGLP